MEILFIKKKNPLQDLLSSLSISAFVLFPTSAKSEGSPLRPSTRLSSPGVPGRAQSKVATR